MKTEAGPRRVRAKRIYEAPSPDDGHRVLVTRYWPRGISRQSVDEYASVLAPSRGLLKSYRAGSITWESFQERYLEEMQGDEQQAEIHRLAELAKSQTTTLLCVCDDQEKCHRWLVQGLVLGIDDGL